MCGTSHLIHELVTVVRRITQPGRVRSTEATYESYVSVVQGQAAPALVIMDQSLVPRWYQPDLVLPGLFLSSSEAEQSLQCLEDNGITHVVQVGSELSPTHPDSFQYLWIDVLDKPFVDIASHFAAANNFVDDAIAAGGRVLVHCRAGVSRSATLVIAYQMWKSKLPVRAAIAATRKARWGVMPNHGFLCQLLEYEQLAYDVTTWQGWGFQRWLEHPLASAAHQLCEEFSPSSRVVPLDVVLASEGVDMESENVAAGQQEIVAVALPASTLASPFAQLLVVADAADTARDVPVR